MNTFDNATTAIVPVYNGAAFIARAIASVQAQTQAASAIIVVDDCSSDNTMAVVQALASQDSRIRLLQNAQNSGPSVSRNRALAETVTPYVAFLDADDEWLPNHLATIASALRAFPNASLVFGDVRDRDTGMSSRAGGGSARRWANPLVQLLDQNPIPQSATALRVEHAKELGGYLVSARFAEDYEFWIRFSLRDFEFVETCDVSVVRTRHGQQVSARFQQKMYASAWSVRRAAVESRYGSIGAIAPEALESLNRSERRDINAALNARDRPLARLVLSQTDWLPLPVARLADVRRLLGWRWPVWRSVAYAYDALPLDVRRWLKSRRTPSVSASASR